ncbi:MAG: glycosyl transferase group 1 [Solirubrobacterales bacterium]|nr:glycosyl transferase group 1 [Solirubrobacterales bacterium]
MRILIFHGYLLRGTGSNVYNARLAAALAGLGHEVHVVCQDRDPVASGMDRPGITIHNPDIGRILPVYVADEYDGFEAKTFLGCTDEEIAHYVAANVAAVRAVAAAHPPDVALANHAVMGPAIVRRALGEGAPYAVKIHGSALEYVVKADPERFAPFAREGLEGARGVLVGSLHTAESLWAAMEGMDLRSKTRLGPPGVDVEEFAPRPRAEAVQGLEALAGRLQTMAHSPEAGSFARDEAAAGRALASLDPGADRLVAFVGKLIVSKGVDLLAAAWPLVLQRVPDARLVIVGFGAFRAGFEGLLDALARGDLDGVRALAAQGRAAEGGPQGRLEMLAAFVDSLEDPGAYRAAAARLPDRVTIVGRLDHAELAVLLPLCEAQVVSSTFPEAFGMVAAEAAACGVLPVSAAHSGLAEVSRVLAGAVPAQARELLAFDLGPRAVQDLAARLVAWLQADVALRAATRDALVATARTRWSWEGVAEGVLAAAQGDLGGLAPPS